MSGTLERGDQTQIAFIPYQKEGRNLFRPAPQEGEGAAFIRYSRTEALLERAIIPLRFYLSDGYVEWEERGVTLSGQLSEMTGKASAALFTALSTRFSDDLLNRGLEHWCRHKANHPTSKLLVVTADYTRARVALDYIKGRGYLAKIATSHDSPSALKHIKEFKFHELDILVTIAMAYEGLDVPQISHIISLTHIRTTPWIEQMISRAVRIDPAAGPYESQVAYVFAPDDPLFSEVVSAIRREQLSLAGGGSKEIATAIPRDQEDGEKEHRITPLDGQIIGSREVSMYGGIPDGVEMPGEITTVRDMEKDLLQQIERHVTRFAFENRYKPHRINAEVKAYFKKPRGEMTLKELQSCLKFVKGTYPLNGGTGNYSATSPPRGNRRRVPTKAQRWEGYYR